MTVIETDAITRLANDFVLFLESSGTDVPAGLFSADVFLDFTAPTWRLQTQGVDGAVALRKAGHPWQGRVPRSRVDRTTTGFVIEVEATWEADGDTWYSAS